MKQKVFVVIPTIRSLRFLTAWQNQFQDCYGLIVEDHRQKEIVTPQKFFKKTYHYSWNDIDRELGKESWIVPRKNAGIRNYGFYKAYKLGADVIITLDDDCFPVEENFIQKHLNNLDFKAATDWFPTYPDPIYMYTRGFPYSIRNKLPVVLSHGLWSGALDLDGKTEIKLPRLLNEKPYPSIRQIIPENYFFPMCSMNLAFKKEVVALMYFPLMGYSPKGKKWKYDRYDDIWAGIFAKKICDHLHLAVVNGSPFVAHRKASIPGSNYEKEKPGMKINETLWQKVVAVKLTKKTPAECYVELAQKIEFPHEPYFEKLRLAMIIWGKLFI